MKRTKKLLAAVFVVGLMGSGAASVAQEKSESAKVAGTGKVKEQHYNFDDMLIDGDYKKPNVAMFKGRDKVRFARLLKLKKSFLPAMLRSARTTALK
jgi:opacity protein-like surface antigen